MYKTFFFYKMWKKVSYLYYTKDQSKNIRIKFSGFLMSIKYFLINLIIIETNFYQFNDNIIAMIIFLNFGNSVYDYV